MVKHSLSFCTREQNQQISRIMGWIGNAVQSIKSVRIRETLHEALAIGMLFCAALIVWKASICMTGSESPMVVVISGSMEPGFKRGDILFLKMMNKEPIRAGDIVVYNVDNRSIPIVHRVIKVHERRDSKEVLFLTKGDNNPDDDIGLYAPGQQWLEQRHIRGRAVGVLPYIGWVTILVTEKPIIKYVLFGAVGLVFILSSKDEYRNNRAYTLS